MQQYNEKTNKIKSALYGFIVADALGVPVEFESRESLAANPVTDMRAFGTYNQKQGTWSDDSSMTLCTYKNIIDGGSYHDLMNKFLMWFENGYMTPHGECFDIGITTREAILNFSSGCSPLESGLKNERDNGNGALMRMLPLLCYYDLDFRDRIKITKDYTMLTHAHQRNIIACIFYVEFCINLLNGIGKFDSYIKTVDLISEIFKNDVELTHYSRLMSKNIHKLDKSSIKSSGYVVDTIEAVLWCFLNNENYKDTVLEAVNLGEDTDTIAAITGGIAGLLYGIDSIPINWLNNLQNKTLLSSVI